MPLTYASYEAASRSLDTTSDRPPLHAHGSERDAWRAVLWRACSGSTGRRAARLRARLVPAACRFELVHRRLQVRRTCVAPERRGQLSRDRRSPGHRTDAGAPGGAVAQQGPARRDSARDAPDPVRLAARTGAQPIKCRAAGHAAAHPRARIRFLRQPAQRTVRRAPGGHRRTVAHRAARRRIGRRRSGHSRYQAVPELADSASRRRTAREERLRTLGFEELGGEQRRRQLATNVALRKWPERSSETT